MSDSGRFEAFVRTHQDMVYATALRLLANPAEAEDVAQAVFLKAFEQFDQLSASDSAAGWLKTVTRHACLNHLSRYRRRWRFFSELVSHNDDDVLEAIPADVSIGDQFERGRGARTAGARHSRPARASACTARPLSFRGVVVSGDRHPRCASAWRRSRPTFTVHVCR
jgi:RNA polymerase sigma factor (sigma-70 family)